MGTSTRSARARNASTRRLGTSAGPLGSPLLLLNLKSYRSSIGPNADRLARLLQTTSREAGVAAALAPSMADLGRLARDVRLPVVAQHADAAGPGPVTGRTVPEALRAAGVVGSLVNHSEYPLPLGVARATVARLKQAELTAIVCADTVATAARLAASRPEFLAIEPPELIGGRISVSEARPEVIEGAVRAVRRVAPRTRVLCGAGVHSAVDVARALSLGAEGVLVASAVATAPDPRRALRELLAGF